MKLRKLLAQLGLAAILLGTFDSQLSTAHAQGTAFTYQGRLDIAGTPASGTNDLTFTLYDAASAGATVGTSNTFNDLVITNGLFTVTLDFGAGAFNGAARWLQIAARPGVSTGAYTNLAPRQAITPSPYAVFAGGAAAAGVTGTLPAGALSGAYSGSVNLSNAANSFAGSGSGLTSLNAANLSSGTVPDARLSTNVALRNGGNTFNGTQAVANGNITLSRNASGAVGPVFRLENNAGTGNDKARLEFYDVNIPRAALEWSIVNNHGGATWNFIDTFNATPAGTNLSRLFINHVGNVGIGTTNPRARLEVVTSAGFTEGLRFSGTDFTGTGTDTNGISVLLQNNLPGFNRADLFIGYSRALAPTNTGLRIIPGGNAAAGGPGVTFVDAVTASGTVLAPLSLNYNAINITTNGNVGLGTFTPSNLLDVAQGGVIGNSTVAVNTHDNANRGTKVSFGYNIQGTELNGMRAVVNPGTAGCGNSGDVLFYTWECNTAVSREVMRINGSGNVGIGTTTPGTRLDVAGEVTCVAVNITSDRNAKEDFKPVSGREVLAKVAALPITEWQYKTQGDARHIGPMAQDFRAAFGTGRDEKHIASVDADGVALAAIQGLNEIVKEKSAEVESLKQSVAELKELVRQLTQPAGR